MTTYNNYDQSSTGINIELTIYRDRDLAVEYLQDFTDDPQVIVQRDRNGAIRYITLTPDRNAPFLLPRITLTMNRERLVHYCNVLSDNTHDMTDDELRELLQSTTQEEYENALYAHDKNAMPHDYTVAGNSQSEWCKVLNNFADPTKAPHDKETIYNILYDQPIYCAVTVNDMEHYLDTRYEYDRISIANELAAQLLERPALPPLFDQILELLPEELY